MNFMDSVRQNSEV